MRKPNRNKILIIGVAVVLLLINLPSLLTPLVTYYATKFARPYGVTFQTIDLNSTSLNLTNLHYKTDDIDVCLADLKIRFRPKELMQKHLRHVTVGDMKIILPPSTEETSSWQEQLAHVRALLFRQPITLPEFPVQIDALQTQKITVQRGADSFHGTCALKLQGNDMHIHIAGVARVGGIEPTLKADFILSKTPRLTLQAQLAKLSAHDISTDQASLLLTGSLKENALAINIDLQAQNFKTPMLTTALSNIQIKGQALLTQETASMQARIFSDTPTLNLRLAHSHPLIVLQQPALTLDAHLKSKLPYGTLQLSAQEVALPEFELAAQDLNVTTDLSVWPNLKTKITAKLANTPIHIDLAFNPQTSDFSAVIPKTTLPLSRLPLASFAQKADFPLQKLTGHVSLEGTVHYQGGEWLTPLHVMFDDVTLQTEGYALKGGQADFHLDKVLSDFIMAQGEQTIKVREIAIGTLLLHNFHTQFTTPTLNNVHLLVAKISAFGGKITLEPLHFKLTDPTHHITLMLDRLALPQLVAFSGVKKLEMTGHLSGKLPFEWTPASYGFKINYSRQSREVE